MPWNCKLSPTIEKCDVLWVKLHENCNNYRMCCMPKEEAFCATINGNQVIRAPQLNATPLHCTPLHWTPLRGTDLGAQWRVCISVGRVSLIADKLFSNCSLCLFAFPSRLFLSGLFLPSSAFSLLGSLLFACLGSVEVQLQLLKLTTPSTPAAEGIWNGSK